MFLSNCGYIIDDIQLLYMRKNNKLVGDLFCLQNIVYGVSATRRRLIGVAADTGDIVSDILTTTGDPFSVTVYDASVNVTYDGKLQFSFRIQFIQNLNMMQGVQWA